MSVNVSGVQVEIKHDSQYSAFARLDNATGVQGFKLGDLMDERGLKLLEGIGRSRFPRTPTGVKAFSDRDLEMELDVANQVADKFRSMYDSDNPLELKETLASGHSVTTTWFVGSFSLPYTPGMEETVMMKCTLKASGADPTYVGF